jgi:hypothetical protein
LPALLDGGDGEISVLADGRSHLPEPDVAAAEDRAVLAVVCPPEDLKPLLLRRFTVWNATSCFGSPCSLRRKYETWSVSMSPSKYWL